MDGSVSKKDDPLKKLPMSESFKLITKMLDYYRLDKMDENNVGSRKFIK